MKKEKTIRTYQRKTKSGKITTVKSHTAKYDAAAEVAKKAARKKGAGDELQAKLTKMPDPKLELQQYLDELKKSRSGASSDTTKTTKPAPKKKLKKPVGGGITGLEPKGKGNTYTDYKGSLFQTDSDSKRDLYSGHTFLSSSQYKTLTELGYKKR